MTGNVIGSIFLDYFPLKIFQQSVFDHYFSVFWQELLFQCWYYFMARDITMQCLLQNEYSDTQKHL